MRSPHPVDVCILALDAEGSCASTSARTKGARRSTSPRRRSARAVGDPARATADSDPAARSVAAQGAGAFADEAGGEVEINWVRCARVGGYL